MLSDEEKKAIKVVNKRTERLIEELKIEEEDLIDEPKIAYLITQIAANKTLVNLIEKQSKEIEELEKNRKVSQNFAKIVATDYISKDKIKAKIEPKLKELDEQINEEWKKYGNSKELQDMEDMYNFLQSLLEKE